MYQETQATILQGSSQFDGQLAVSMYAQKTTKGDVNMNITIIDETLYQANKAECDEDIATFKAHAEDI